MKKEFNNKSQELPPMHPKYAGIASWARMLKKRIDKPMLVSLGYYNTSALVIKKFSGAQLVNHSPDAFDCLHIF